MVQLEEFRAEVRDWCRVHVPKDWQRQQTSVSDGDFVAFQSDWFQELRRAGYAVPHWPQEWGGGMSVAEQAILYQELAISDAPRLVLAFVAIHHAASTLLGAGSDRQKAAHLPAILEGEVWCQGFSEPDAGSDLASLKASAHLEGDKFIINGQKVWSSGAHYADWCLLLARTDPTAPKRAGISYFLMQMETPGIDVRPIRQATGERHFCEIFLEDVIVPAANLVGPLNGGWKVAQTTLGAERGMTMLELAERLAIAFDNLVEMCRQATTDGRFLIGNTAVADRLATFDVELTALRLLCRNTAHRAESGQAGPADASVSKLFYSELLQRMTGFAAELSGLDGLTTLAKPRSSGWESGAWFLDHIGSWEWTIPGGTSEIQRTIIAERGLGMPREPNIS